jgi:5,10-methylene-tetrahydrofolate dehydrogenase/methenyl tetrahydrofolate cyclohydrolase
MKCYYVIFGTKHVRSVHAILVEVPVLHANASSRLAVMDPDKDDNRTLRAGLLSEFKEQNSTDTIDCTVMKVAWLSKRQSEQRVGSLVI